MVLTHLKLAKHRGLAALLLAATTLGLALLALTLAPSDSAYASHVSVDMGDFAYVPNNLTVKAGGRVVFINKGGVAHNVTAVDGSWDSGVVEPGAFYSQVFTKPGVYRFYSRFYASSSSDEGMTGEVTVLAQTTETPTPLPYAPDPNAIQVPEGYEVDVLATGLTLPASLAVGPDGRVYVAESGVSMPTFVIPPTIKRVNADHTLTTVAPAAGSSFQINLLGITFSPNGQLYASHNGKISRVNPDGSLFDIVTGLPSQGSHSNEHMQFGPDGKLYFSQGSVTNAGVVGPGQDGAPPPPPPVREIPCRTITLVGQNFTDTNGVVTGAYQPLGTPSEPGQIIPGALPCGGAVLRVNPDGSNMELAGWGFRNPFGIRFAPPGHLLAGSLFVTNNNLDAAPPRPVGGVRDDLYMIFQPANITTATAPWFGWPDYANGQPVSSAVFSPSASLLWESHPPLQNAVVDFAEGAVPGGLDFSTSAAFGFVGDAFVAQWGGGRGANANPPNVMRVHAELMPTGQISRTLSVFAVSKEPGRIDSPGFGGLNHPLDVKFSANGEEMYIADFANFAQPVGSGTIWRVRRIQPTATPTLTPTHTSIPPTLTSTPTPTHTSVPPTVTNTALPPTATNTAAPPTVTNTPVPPTATNTAAPPTATSTAAPPTRTATNTPVPPTATNTAVPPTATRTATATPVPPTATSTAALPTSTATNTPVPPTRTATPRPTGTPIVCDPTTPGNVCSGIVVIRAYIDFGCDGFFNRGTDWPLAGTTITVRLPDGTVRTAVVDENGNATVSGINLGTGQTLTVMADSAPPSPTWVQQFGYDVTPCPRAPASVTLGRANFGVFDVAFVDFTYTITR